MATDVRHLAVRSPSNGLKFAVARVAAPGCMATVECDGFPTEVAARQYAGQLDEQSRREDLRIAQFLQPTERRLAPGFYNDTALQ